MNIKLILILFAINFGLKLNAQNVTDNIIIMTDTIFSKYKIEYITYLDKEKILSNSNIDYFKKLENAKKEIESILNNLDKSNYEKRKPYLYARGNIRNQIELINSSIELKKSNEAAKKAQEDRETAEKILKSLQSPKED